MSSFSPLSFSPFSSPTGSPTASSPEFRIKQLPQNFKPFRRVITGPQEQVSQTLQLPGRSSSDDIIRPRVKSNSRGPSPLNSPFHNAFYSLYESPSESKVETFLMTYTMFIPPDVSLNALITSEFQLAVSSSTGNNVKEALSLLLLISIRNSFVHFTKPEIHYLLGLLKIDPLFHATLNVFKLSLLNRHHQATTNSSDTTANSQQDTDGTSSLNFDEMNPAEFVKQITFTESQKFSQIRPRDFILQATGGKGGSIAQGHLGWMIQWFNTVSNWVATVLLQSESSKQFTARLMKFISIAKLFYDLGNFNSLMEIVTGLKCSSIERLKYGWVDLPEKYQQMFKEISAVMDPSKRFFAYRTELKKWEDKLDSSNSKSNSNSSPSSYLPYIGLITRDLTISCEGNEKYSPDGSNVNWELLDLLSQQLKIVTKSQLLITKAFEGEPFLPCPSLTGVIYDEDTLYDLSLQKQALAGSAILGQVGNPGSPGQAEHDGSGISTEDSIDLREEVESSSSNSDVNSDNEVESNQAGFQSSPIDWTPQDVSAWLKMIALGEFCALFEKNEVCGEDLFDLTAEDLIGIGMTKLGHRKRLLKKINVLRIVSSTKCGKW